MENDLSRDIGRILGDYLADYNRLSKEFGEYKEILSRLQSQTESNSSDIREIQSQTQSNSRDIREIQSNNNLSEMYNKHAKIMDEEIAKLTEEKDAYAEEIDRLRDNVIEQKDLYQTQLEENENLRKTYISQQEKYEDVVDGMIYNLFVKVKASDPKYENSSYEGFVAAYITEDTIAEKYTAEKRSIIGGQKRFDQNFNDFMDNLLTAFNKIHDRSLTRQKVREGDIFADDKYSKTENSKVNGKINEVLLIGIEEGNKIFRGCKSYIEI